MRRDIIWEHAYQGREEAWVVGEVMGGDLIRWGGPGGTDSTAPTLGLPLCLVEKLTSISFPVTSLVSMASSFFFFAFSMHTMLKSTLESWDPANEPTGGRGRISPSEKRREG